jgi:hypothetical protein
MKEEKRKQTNKKGNKDLSEMIIHTSILITQFVVLL